MNDFKLSIACVNNPESDMRSVSFNDGFETKFFGRLIFERLCIEEHKPYSVRSVQDLIMLPAARPQDQFKYDATLFFFFRKFFGQPIINGEVYNFMDFIKIYWKLNPKYFRNQTIILPHYNCTSLAHKVFEFRKSFCRRIFVPSVDSELGLDFMLREISELIEYDEFNEDNLDCLEYTTVVSKASVQALHKGSVT